MSTDKVELIFVFDDALSVVAEARVRGHLDHVVAKTIDGKRYPLCFYDYARMHQDLFSQSDNSRPFIAEPGMIILPEITLETMQYAVERLFIEGFFVYLTPLDQRHILDKESFQWPPPLEF